MYSLKTLHFLGDYGGCYHYRVDVPFSSLKRYGVYNSNYCFIPSSPTISQDQMLVDMIRDFDIVIIQRCYILEFVNKVSAICELLGKPLVFETDDDYFNLIPSNPAYYAIVRDQKLFSKFNEYRQKAMALAYEGKELESKEEEDKAMEILPALNQSRLDGLADYKEILKMVDFVTVSTEELARTIRPYNKNVFVFQNNIDRIFPWKDALPLQSFMSPNADGKTVTIKLEETLGLVRMPSYGITADKQIQLLPRIGYSATESHRGEDWWTIGNALNEYMDENPKGYLISFIGDPWFFHQLKNKSYAFNVQGSDYDKYMANLRNIDIMLCPLAPTIFNMSKSDIKLVEAGAWGIPGLAPRYITYTRNWVEEETTLFYSNADEFKYQLDRLVKDHDLRKRLGRNSLEYVAKNRIEDQHSEARYKFLVNVKNSKKQLEVMC
jgi:glycosyltransferase involved in cell wall biosynthesis